MADTATTSNRFRKQSLGSNLNVWGDPYLNDNFDLIDSSLDGQTSLTLTGGTSTLTATNYAADQSRERMLIMASSTLTSNQIIIIPSVPKLYFVVNGLTMAGFTLTIKTSSGVAASIPSGGSYIVSCDGTDCAVRRTLDYASNELTNVGSATASASAANFGQVVTATENRSMGGFRLTNVGTGTAAADAVNLTQMNAAIAAAGIPAASGAVLISLTDTTPNYLGAKVFMAGTIGLTTANPSGNSALLIPQFVGATTAAVGTLGLVPASGTADTGNFLRGDGTWAAAASVLETQVFS